MGTSCKSSKLIHGGLRYLESAQFKLVKECLLERKRLLHNAPELVKLIPFYIPVYTTSTRPAWLIWLGLSIYSLFSLKAFKIIGKHQWPLLDNIKTENLKTVFKYYDAQTDDQLLTRAVAKSAQRNGANFIYNADFIHASSNNKIHEVSYIKNQHRYTIKSHYIINCSGPWVKDTQDKIHPSLKLPSIDLVSGAHIVIDTGTTQGAYYLEAKDKRAVFVLPWKGSYTLIGTTEAIHKDSADNVTARRQDVTYLIDVYNQYFHKKISERNIVDEFAGLRVLPKNDSSTFNKSRESLIIESADCPGLITLIGGKLTAYRAAAEQVVGKIKLPKKRPVETTRSTKISIL